MTERPPFHNLPDLLAWLHTLDPIEHIHLARLLANTATTGALARDADALVYEMTRTRSRAEVAELLGTTVSNVQRAVSSHLTRTGESGRRGPRSGRGSA